MLGSSFSLWNFMAFLANLFMFWQDYEFEFSESYEKMPLLCFSFWTR